MKTQTYTVDDFLFLKVKKLWAHFKTESFAFKCVCAYMFVEYFRPQAIFKWLDFLPWAQLFLGLAIIGIFTDSKAKLRFTAMHTFLIFFAVIIHLSMITAYDVGWSFDYYIFFIQWIIIFFVITSIVTTRERFYIFFMVFFLCCLKIAIGTSRIWIMRGFGFTSWGLMGPPGYFQNSGELAVLMLVLFPIGYYLYKAYKNDVRRWEKYLLLAATICPILTILGSSSRGAQIALVIQLLLMFYKQIFKPKVLILIVLICSIGWNILPEEQKLRFTEIGEDKSSIQRKLYWEHGWDMMKDNPILGVGYYNFQPYYQDHYFKDVLYSYAQLPHNILIQIGTDSGFTGLLIYLLIIMASLIMKRPRIGTSSIVSEPFYNALWISLKLGVVGFFIAGQFVTIGYYPFLWISIALQISLISSFTK
ncbi:hypothetical protein CA267_015105 [Alteromonas pelagimontana]|uniref:O-antigen ligase family protein n=1 Tax=Alteromonas pelagimontana TaxID=1858656 RepID=A0A6M4MIP5_9ALTE|nr:O-antigen ligase family protein [Alteromonas pelagimontana]QJR81986.1 hypothetical protein CA267_015105 [Alteromonas pelagimontana]